MPVSEFIGKKFFLMSMETVIKDKIPQNRYYRLCSNLSEMCKSITQTRVQVNQYNGLRLG